MQQNFLNFHKIIAIYIVLFAYFVVATYWLIIGGICLAKIFTGVYAPEMSLWWMILFYSSEAGGIIGVIFRWFASVFALYTSIVLFRRGANLMKAIKLASVALLMESVYFISLIPTVILGWIYYFTTDQVYYFNHTPKEIVLLINGLGCLPMAFLTPATLLKLSSTINRGKSFYEILKWSCCTSLVYLFAVFWFNYLTVWFATLIPWPRRGQPGLTFLFDPINCASFIATVIGLLLINIFAVKTLIPGIKKPFKIPTAKKVGYLMLALGGYYILVISLYVLSGGYAAHPTAWHEIIGPAHNPDLWCISFSIAGLFLILS